MAMLTSIAEFLLPKSFQRKIKRWSLNHAHVRLSKHPKFSEAEFRDILTNRLGVKPGSAVFIHSSVDKLNIGFPASKVIPMLLDIVGKEGTLLFPSTHITGDTENCLNESFCFDVNKTPTKMGLLAEFARRHKNASRSMHPTNSVVAIGKHAHDLVHEHTNSVYPCGEKSPYYKIIGFNGIFIGLGVNSDNLTFVHCIEDALKDAFPIKTRKDKIYSVTVIDGNGKKQQIETLVAHPDIALRNVKGFMKQHIPASIGQDFQIRGVDFFTFDAKMLFDKMSSLAKENTTIYNLPLIKLINLFRRTTS
ncbi:MAG: AAC(3) family N-acetyltransferase [Candidatus Omnitrophica bacterium]|nr:AAC(3) family N-acetyltransferase [Candidatus Omnitrophota bacterium]